MKTLNKITRAIAQELHKCPEIIEGRKLMSLYAEINYIKLKKMKR